MTEAVFDCMQKRRSIRKFCDTSVEKPTVEKILRAGTVAPSSKNNQPWRFVVVTGDAKKELLAAMRGGLAREKNNPLLPNSAKHLSGAWHTLQIMEEAPLVVLVLRAYGFGLSVLPSTEERVSEICDMQSLGACMQNMTLAATAMGLGSLWICDTFFAYAELCAWLRRKESLAAAMAFGYPDERPAPRPRADIKQITEWRE